MTEHRSTDLRILQEGGCPKQQQWYGTRALRLSECSGDDDSQRKLEQVDRCAGQHTRSACGWSDLGGNLQCEVVAYFPKVDILTHQVLYRQRLGKRFQLSKQANHHPVSLWRAALVLMT